jgi:hypothetical protein
MVAEEDNALLGPRPEEPLGGLPDPGATEVDDPCDGFDNDVDGYVDEGCYCREDEAQPCFPGHPSRVGVGICEAGVQRCHGVGGDFRLGSWGECLGAVLPRAEICSNGIDEDCSGEDTACPPPVDACEPGEMQSCYPGPESTLDVGVCRAGTQTCSAVAAWGACEGAIVPDDEVCGNAVDEDCDGSDETC